MDTGPISVIGIFFFLLITGLIAPGIFIIVIILIVLILPLIVTGNCCALGGHDWETVMVNGRGFRMGLSAYDYDRCKRCGVNCRIEFG